MSSNKRIEERAMTMCGVTGRMSAIIPWDNSTTFMHQQFYSEERPVRGYVAGGLMRVEVRFNDNPRNGHNTFAITAEVCTNESRRRSDIQAGGCMHDEIVKVFPEFAHLIKWHLVSTDEPMHYIANTTYHAEEHGPRYAWVYYVGKAMTDPLGLADEPHDKEYLLGYFEAEKAKKAEGVKDYCVQWDEKTAKVANFDHARSSAAWPEATDEQLSLPKEELTALLQARLPALLAAFKADMLACGFLWSADDVPVQS